MDGAGLLPGTIRVPQQLLHRRKDLLDEFDRRLGAARRSDERLSVVKLGRVHHES
jgi:hypothetical protein